MDYPIKRSGYVFNKRTAPAFQKMRRNGIILPPIRIEDEVTHVLTSHYDRLLRKMADSIKAVKLFTTDSRVMTTDGLFQEILAQMQDSLLRSVNGDKEKLEKNIMRLLTDAGEKYFKDFLEDADEKVRLRVSYALDKDEVFQERIDYLMQDYLLVSMDRIDWEENELKRRFLIELTRFAQGDVPTLEDIKDTIAAMKETSVREARFFARDQFAKLNKSLTLASFEQAEVKYVQWWCVMDGRVRPTHKAVNKQVFKITELPTDPKTGRPLHLDYNCRCSLTPVYKED